MTNTNLLPDLELVVRTWLVDQAAVAALVGTDDRGQVRVYTRLPDPLPSTPFVRIRRLPSPPAKRGRVWLDAGVVQFDAYGGTQRQANRLAETIRQHLDGLDTAAIVEGVVTGVDHGTFGYLPDPDLLTASGNARERYVLDAIIYAHPER